MGMFLIYSIGNATARCAFSTQNFDTCTADVMGAKTLVREGSHTHWVVDDTPHQMLGMVVIAIGIWLATLICGTLAFRFLNTNWSDPDASLFPGITRYPIVNKVTALVFCIWSVVALIMKLTTAPAPPPVVQQRAPRPIDESAQPHFEKGVAFWNAGNAGAAVTELRVAANIQPSAAIYHWLGWIALQSRDLHSAIQWSTRLTELDPNYNKGSGYAIRAAAFYQLKNEPKAYPNAKAACERGDTYGCTLADYLWEQRDRWATPAMLQDFKSPNSH
jgi:tetratricopeptide (TPR) repeat protein